MFLSHGHQASEKSDRPWVESNDKFQGQRSNVLLEDIIVSEYKSIFKITGQTNFDWTKASVQPSEPVSYVAGGSVCTRDTPSQISNIDIVAVYGIGNPFEHTRIGSSVSRQVLDCWLDKTAVTELVSLTPDRSAILNFGYVPPAKKTVRVDSGYRRQSRLNSPRARGEVGIGALESLLVMPNMPQTDNRTTEISESIVAVVPNEEKAYVTDPGFLTWRRHLSPLANLVAGSLGIRSSDGYEYDSNRWIKGCVDVKPLRRSTCATSKDNSFSQEANRSFPGIDMVIRRPDAYHVSVDSSLFYEIIAFILVAPTAAFVITSWGMIEEFPLCTRDHSARLLLGLIQAPAVAEFILATVIYSIATTVYSLRRYNENLQGGISSVVFMLSAIGGLWLNCDLQSIVLCIFPWAIIVALLLSSGLHRITWISRYSADLKVYEHS